MLLHDACKSINMEKVQRRKYSHKINCLTFLILILSNIISISTTILSMYIITKEFTSQAETRGAVHGHDHLHGQPGHVGERMKVEEKDTLVADVDTLVEEVDTLVVEVDTEVARV